MAVSIGTLIGYLQLDDKLSPALKVAQANVATTARSLEKLGEASTKAGHAMLPISAAITAAGVAAFKFGKDFEKTLTQIETLAGGSAEQVVQYKAAIMDMVKEVGKSPQELAEALYFITSSGQSGAAALDTLRVSAKASALGLGETKTVADAATSAINAYGAEQLSSAEAVRVLVATVREGKGEADAIAGSLGRVIPIAAEMGVKFQDLGAFMAATTKIGLSAEEAATALRGALTTMSAPTKEQTEAFASLAERGLLPLGFSLADVRKKIKEEGLAQGFMQLTEATKGNSEALTAIIGNVRAATGVLGAYGRQAESTMEVQKRLRTDLHEVDKGFAQLTKTVDFQWNQLLANLQGNAVNAFDAVKVSFSNFIIGGVKITEGIDKMIKYFTMLPQPVQQAGLAIVGMTALAGPALIGFGALAKGVAVAMEGAASAMGLLAKGMPAIISGLTMLGTAAAVAAAGFAGWKIGEKIGDLKLFGDEQMSVGESFSYGLLKIQQWTGFLDASDRDIENSILAQRNLGQEVKNTATAFDEAGIAAISYEQCVAELASPTEQAKNLTADWKNQMAELQVQVLSLSDEQREAIRTGLEMQKNTADIATGLGVTEAAVKAYAAGLEEGKKKVDEFIEKQRKSAEETRKLGEELRQATVAQQGTDQDARLAAIDQWFNNEVAAIEGVGEAYKQHYAALQALRDQRKAAELSNIAEMNAQSLEALQQRAAKERQTYEDMLTSGLTFSRDVLDAQLQKVRNLEQAVRDYGHAFTTSQEEGAKAAQATNDFFDHMYDTVEQTLERMGKLKQAVTETYTFDIPALTKTQKEQINRSSAMTYELNQDPNAGLKKKLHQLEDLEGTYAPKSAAQYKQMIDDQVLLAQLRKLNLDEPAVPVSTRVTANTTTVNGGTSPQTTQAVSGSGAAAAVGVGVMNNYINGTGEQVAKVIQDQIMGTLKVGRQFGAV